ncbi:Rnf-Nqr domain containing protein [Allofournierella sp.]|uniref:Rnf-Nqr domain containing protein n=1 Tax=Allofournierella sp. TaxID=1940256 RepID=UPI00208705FE|nr:electron transport complex subunit A [Oscillospiraceae bacterium]
MSNVIEACGVFFFYAVAAVFAQNAVFSRALGVSRLVKLVEDSTVDTLTFGGLMCLIQLIAAPLAHYANRWIQPLPFRGAIRPLVFVLCSTAAFLVVLALVLLVFRLQNAKQVVAVLPMATFNSAVMGMLLITATQSFTLLQTLGFALGSGVGYMMAVVIVTEGQRKLRSRSVPAAFKGLPVTLLYIGILSLAIYGFTGHRPSI